MAHFYEYLEFSSDEDRENQLDVYVAITSQLPETFIALILASVSGESSMPT